MIDINIEKIGKQLKSKKHELPVGMTKAQISSWLAEKRIELRKERQSIVEHKL